MTAAYWFVAVIMTYGAADYLFNWAGRKPWLHPVILPAIAGVWVIYWFDLPFAPFVEGIRVFHVLLMAAVVALALPLYRSFAAIRKDPEAVISAIVGGSIAGSGSAVALSMALKAPMALSASLASKSVTTPIAIVLAEEIGGIPSIAAAVVIITGLVVAIIGPRFLHLFGIDGDITVGLAMGTAGHALGMAEAVRRSDLMGASAAFAMAGNGLITAVLLPIIWP